jgi:transposase-like protein
MVNTDFKNLIEVSEYFADPIRANQYLIQLRWNGDITCAHCKHDKVYTLKGQGRYKCGSCKKLFSATKGTIFENSPIPLQKWFTAIYLIASHKKGISSYQLARDLSLTQKSAWFVLHRVRFASQTGSFEFDKAGGIYEADETFIGGKEKNKHQSRYAKNQKIEDERENKKLGIEPVRNMGRNVGSKTAVAGIVQRGGNVTAKVVRDTKSKTLIDHIKDNVELGSTIVTDEWQSYKKLSIDFAHATVQHRLGEYVNGQFHTNSIEGFWAQLKRGIYGIYHHVSPKHLDKYIDEFEFRYNTRKFTERDRFDKMLTMVSKRLTYAQLIANG